MLFGNRLQYSEGPCRYAMLQRGRAEEKSVYISASYRYTLLDMSIKLFVLPLQWILATSVETVHELEIITKPGYMSEHLASMLRYARQQCLLPDMHVRRLNIRHPLTFSISVPFVARIGAKG
jgi:hypothetical protein